MITFININQSEPFRKLKSFYDKAFELNQKSIDAIAVSSYSNINSIVDSRYVNLKYIDDNKFIFFSNYNSPKAQQFNEHDQVSILIFWNTINVQIRLSGKINKTSKSYNKTYFAKRNSGKNALAISSNQSEEIESYEIVKHNYFKTFNNNDLTICPDYWGGFYFIPSSIEFWKGEKDRINLREKYTFKNNIWKKTILSP